MRTRRLREQESDLDITSFMNLMIILVPVLLMTMVFSHISVLDIRLPDMASDAAAAEQDPEDRTLELVIYDDRLVVNYPAGNEWRSFAQEDGEYPFAQLSEFLQAAKRKLRDEGINKRDILILSQADTNYQTLVTAMDTVRSYTAVVAASTVNAELFPEISLGDAPAAADNAQSTGGDQ